METIDLVGANVVICGDFNLWIDDQSLYSPQEFLELMDSFHMVNRVLESTSIGGHILDLVFSDKSNDVVGNVKVDDICCISPVHKLVSFRILYTYNKKQTKLLRFRNKVDLVPKQFIRTVVQTVNTNKQNECEHGLIICECINCFVKLYNDTTRNAYDESCPYVERQIVIMDNAPWFNGDVMRAKMEKRRKESRWRRTRTDAARRQYQDARNKQVDKS